MTSHCRELRRRLQRQQFRYLWPIEWQVPARTDPDLEHAAFGRADHPLAIRPKLLVAHREIAEPRQDEVTIKGHRFDACDCRDHDMWRPLTANARALSIALRS